MVSFPTYGIVDEEANIVWEVDAPSGSQIVHTAIHYDTESHPGSFGLGVTPGDSGYLDLTTEFASGEFVSGNFEATITPSVTLYFRAHAIIDGNHYWTDEETILIAFDGAITEEIFEIEMSSSGFSPSSLTINSGDTVIFSAIDGSRRWPATNNHPTHTLYPESSIQKCQTSEKDEIFDSCSVVAEGETYSFTFTNAGTWGYHDHFSPAKKGTITVA